MKRIAALATLGLLAAMLGACDRGPRGERLGRDETMLSVTATAKGDSKPDEARFTVGVSSIGTDAGAATQANNAKMTAVIAALKQAGIAEGDMQTQNLTVERQDYGANKGRYEANNQVAVRVRAIGKVSGAIGAATGAGANVVSGPNLGTADPEAASRALAGNAFKAARARADAYAAAAGLKVVRVLTIRDGGNPPEPMLAENMADMKVAAPMSLAPPVLAGASTTEVTVGVTFALAPK